eukprot:11932672-Heterocapsa_arctica.AAC.1
MSAILVVGEVHTDVAVALFPRLLFLPPFDLGLVPNQVFFGAALARLGSPGSQARVFVANVRISGAPIAVFVAHMVQ